MSKYAFFRALRWAAIVMLFAAGLDGLSGAGFFGLSARHAQRAASLLFFSVASLLAFRSVRKSNFKSSLSTPTAGIATIPALEQIPDLQPETLALENAADLRKLRQAENKLRESEEQYRLLVATIPEGVWKTDAKGNVKFVSPQVETILGYSAAEFLQHGDSLWFNSVHVEDKDRVAQAFESLIKDGKPYDIECRVRRKTGEWLWAHDRAVATNDSDGLRVATGLISDITERKQAEESLLFKTALLEAQAETTIDGILVVDDSHQIVLANKQFKTNFGIPDEVLSARDDHSVLNYVTAQVDDRAAFLEKVEYLYSHQNEKSRDELKLKDGKVFDRYSAPLVDSKGRHRGRIWYFRDITDRKLAEERIQFLAYSDALTGLPNRRLLQDRLTQALASAHRRGDKVALLFLDLDRFKNINDSMGHSAADRLLQEIARRLIACGREQDTIARVGGDEFLIVLTALKDATDAAVAAERLMDAVTRDYLIEGRVLNITCSLGISIFPEHGRDAEALIKNADTAMYSAKESGRNGIRFFTEDIDAQAEERLTLENSLRLALERKEFFLLYQPQADIITGTIVGLEALLRWQPPHSDLVPPDKFIPVAENCGLIVPIGEWVLRTACSQARQWQEDGLPPVRVAVNVSAVQFRRPGFPEYVKRVLRETGLAPQYLELELTESLLLANAEVNLSVFQELNAMGVTLAIDDFGTGYSNFGYLKKFRVSKLKIDGSFIRDLAANPDDAAITSAIISMAKSLRLKVIAECVENETQMSFLRACDCDEIQGFYFSEPLAADRVPGKLQSNLSTLTLPNAIGKEL